MPTAEHKALFAAMRFPTQRANRGLSYGALANLRTQQRRPHRQESHPCRDSGKRRSRGPSRTTSESSTTFVERLLKQPRPRAACVAAAVLILRPLAYCMGTSSTRRFWSASLRGSSSHIHAEPVGFAKCTCRSRSARREGQSSPWGAVEQAGVEDVVAVKGGGGGGGVMIGSHM